MVGITRSKVICFFGCLFLLFLLLLFLTSTVKLFNFCWLLACIGFFWLFGLCLLFAFVDFLASIGFWLLVAFGFYWHFCFCWLFGFVNFWLLSAFWLVLASGFCWLSSFVGFCWRLDSTSICFFWLLLAVRVFRFVGLRFCWLFNISKNDKELYALQWLQVIFASSCCCCCCCCFAGGGGGNSRGSMLRGEALPHPRQPPSSFEILDAKIYVILICFVVVLVLVVLVFLWWSVGSTVAFFLMVFWLWWSFFVWGRGGVCVVLWCFPPGVVAMVFVWCCFGCVWCLWSRWCFCVENSCRSMMAQQRFLTPSPRLHRLHVAMPRRKVLQSWRVSIWLGWAHKQINICPLAILAWLVDLAGLYTTRFFCIHDVWKPGACRRGLDWACEIF